MKNKGYESKLFSKSGSYTVQVLVDGQELFKGPIEATSIRDAFNRAYSRVPLAVSTDRIEVKIMS